MAKATQETTVEIKAPNLKVAQFHIRGTAPLVQLAFGQKVINQMREGMETGKKRGKADRPKRNFQQEFEEAIHRSTEGWAGIPAGAFRSAMIDACRLVNYKMTYAKLSVFVIADGLDAVDGTPLVQIIGTPRPVVHHVRNATGVVDLRSRAMFEPWESKVNIRYDADQFSSADVANLLMRAGLQVGIGEGRPNSKNSHGMGFGTFEVI